METNPDDAEAVPPRAEIKPSLCDLRTTIRPRGVIFERFVPQPFDSLGNPSIVRRGLSQKIVSHKGRERAEESSVPDLWERGFSQIRVQDQGRQQETARPEVEPYPEPKDGWSRSMKRECARIHFSSGRAVVKRRGAC